MGSLPSHRRGPTAMLWERLRHASTAHTLQQKNLGRSRRLPAAAEAVPRGVRPVVVGDFPPSRDLPHTVWRWWKAGVRPGQHHLKALLDLADDFGLGPVHPKREGRASARLEPQALKRKWVAYTVARTGRPLHLQQRPPPHIAVSSCSDRVPKKNALTNHRMHA